MKNALLSLAVLALAASSTFAQGPPGGGPPPPPPVYIPAVSITDVIVRIVHHPISGVVIDQEVYVYATASGLELNTDYSMGGSFNADLLWPDWNSYTLTSTDFNSGSSRTKSLVWHFHEADMPPYFPDYDCACTMRLWQDLYLEDEDYVDDQSDEWTIIHITAE